LRRGSIRFLETVGRFVSYERVLGDDRLVVGLNASRDDEAVLRLPPGRWIEPLFEEERRGDRAIPALSYALLKRIG